MIKHNSPRNVYSTYNPILSLHPRIRQVVNDRFIKPILVTFFKEKGGLEAHDELDMDRIATEIEFEEKESDESFVKTYIYQEIINEIGKQTDGKVNFKPKYTISFDEGLTLFHADESCYPYNDIFAGTGLANTYENTDKIFYGAMCLGERPILYYIHIDFQEILRFIKTIPYIKPVIIAQKPKIIQTPKQTRNTLISRVIANKQMKLQTASVEEKQNLNLDISHLLSLSEQEIVGKRGELRINLSWNTTDDLDLEIDTASGTIKYSNKIVEHNGVIGELDVDANAGNNMTSTPQENVHWNGIPEGLHTVRVNFYSKKEKEKVPFTLFVENGDNSRIYENYVTSIGEGKMKTVLKFNGKNGEVEFLEELRNKTI